MAVLALPGRTRLLLIPVWFGPGWTRLSLQPGGQLREVTSAAPVGFAVDALPATGAAVWVRADGTKIAQSGTAGVQVMVLPKPRGSRGRWAPSRGGRVEFEVRGASRDEAFASQ